MTNLSSLQLTSPSCAAMVRRTLAPSLQESVFNYYEQLFTAPHLESEITRAPGVSYNPRPARILELVLAHAQATVLSESVLHAALAAELPSEELDLKVTKEIKKVVQEIHGDQLPTTDEAQLLWLIYRLDRTRHLHMSRWAEEEQRRYLSVISTQLSTHATAAPCKNIVEKLTHALNQQQRILDKKSEHQ